MKTIRSIGEAILYYGAFRGGATLPLAAFAIESAANDYASHLKGGVVRPIYMIVGERCPQCGGLTPAAPDAETARRR